MPKPRKVPVPLVVAEDASPVQKTSSDPIHVTRIYHLGQEIIRARVMRDFYVQQSLAVVEVMNDHKEWTGLTGSDARLWHTSHITVSQLQTLANQLASVAASILTVGG
jgi:hypothetical protein